MYPLTLENFDKCCRWCLSFAGEKNPILESCLDTMLYAITSLKVLLDDGYPQLSCRSCIMKLSAAYNFRQMAIQNYEKLTTVIKVPFEEAIICLPCHNLLTSQENRSLGHDMICIACGKSVSRLRHHSVEDDIHLLHQDFAPNLLGILQTTQQKRLEEHIQNVHIISNIITEADSDHESYAMSAINMKAVETLDDDEPVVREKERRGWITGQPVVCGNETLGKVTDSQTEVNPTVSSTAVALINADTFLKCRHCPAKFSSIGDRRVHTLTHSERCKHCHKVVKRQNILRHARTHTQERRYACRVCDKRFHDLTNRNRHERNHSELDSACAPHKYLCNYCGKNYKWRTSLCRHLRSHKARSLFCAVCRLQFADLVAWRRHARTHSQREFHSCPKCETKKFASQKTLDNHLKTVHAHRRLTFPCSLCHKFYYDKASLVRHRTVHSRPPIKCQHCNKICANNRSLTRHLLVHENIISPT